ncbi:MAG: flavodoxin family protein [Acidobacteria bacterium]|nr:flavodoxin family protein [Acidobacteriota bacterium]
MGRVAIVYHSGYGHTAAQAEAVARGAASVEGTTVEVFTSDDAITNLEKLNDFDAIIFGSPTYMGSVSSKMKAFMEASSKMWMELKWKDKIAAGFSNSGSLSGDKLNTLLQFAVFAGQHAMIWVGMDVLPSGAPGDPESINRVGSFLGAMAQSTHGTAVPPDGDLKTAELLGRRVALTAQQWVRGRQ